MKSTYTYSCPLVCSSPHWETPQHVFVDGETARVTCKHFACSFGILQNTGTIGQITQAWWTSKPKNKMHKQILQITPVAIIWEIWKGWCACTYGDQKRISQARIIYQVEWNIKTALYKLLPQINFSISLGTIFVI